MTPTARIHDLERVEVEHYLASATQRGVVKLRAVSEPAILLGELTPDSARNLALDLLDSAARASYEEDLAAGLRAGGGSTATVVAALIAVRNGEAARHEGR